MISKIKDGRASVCPTGEEDFLIPCQTLIVAIGQDIVSEPFERAGIPAKRGRFLAQKDSSIAEKDGVFAGGDCVTGPATVIRAIAAGKVAAANIDNYLGFNHKIESGGVVPEPRIENKTPCGRVTMMERNTTERKKEFNIVENGMTSSPRTDSPTANCSLNGGR